MTNATRPGPRRRVQISTLTVLTAAKRIEARSTTIRAIAEEWGVSLTIAYRYLNGDGSLKVAGLKLAAPSLE